MEEIGRLEFKDFSRAEIIDLERRMPKGLIEYRERELGEDEMGVLDPLTATVIVTVALTGLSIFGAWLLKNRHKKIVEYEIESNGTRRTMKVEISSSTTEADVVAEVMKGIKAIADDE